MLLIGSYTFLPPMLETSLERSLRDQLGLRSAPEVDVESRPPPKMLAGEFDGGRVVLERPDLGDVRPEQVAVDLDPFDIAVLDSIFGGLEVREPLSGRLRAELSEGEIERISETNTPFGVEDVQLEKDRVLIRSTTEVFTVEVPIFVQGRLRLEGQRLVFEPQEVRAFDVDVPGDLADRLLSESDFSYPLTDLPYGIKLSGVEVDRDRLVLSGEVERLPLEGVGG